MSSIIHCQEELINSTLMKTWAIFYFAAEKSRISICCLVMCWFSPLGCLTDVHHICRYLKYLFALHPRFSHLRLNSRGISDGNLKQNNSRKNRKTDECFFMLFLTYIFWHGGQVCQFNYGCLSQMNVLSCDGISKCLINKTLHNEQYMCCCLCYTTPIHSPVLTRNIM